MKHLMRPEFDQYRIKEQWVKDLYGNYGDSKNGMFRVPGPLKADLICIVSDGLNWEHVSVTVSGQRRCPTWEEMCFVKDLFFEGEETVMQFHPAKSQYVNVHPYCLHLWRPRGIDVPLPPRDLVG